MADAADMTPDAADQSAAEKAYAEAAAAVEVKPVAAPRQQPAKTAPAAKAALPARAIRPAKAAARKSAKPKAAKPAPQKVAPAADKTMPVKTSPISKLKDTIMATTTEDFTAKIKDAVSEAQDRAKTAFEKGQAALGEYGEFTKGNLEAVVESGKILAAGIQDIGKDYVAEGKTALETVTADIKQLAAVKSPADFFKLQGELLRRNFDAAVASGSKHSEKAVKLANEAFAPIQNRVSIAIEKVKQAA